MDEKNLDEKSRAQLLSLARKSIEHGLSKGSPIKVNLKEYAAELQEMGATFVTLMLDQRLRGCIGSIIAHAPLVEDLVNNAFNAAFKDPRFPPLTEPELPSISIQISKLSTPEPMKFQNETDFLTQLRPNIDGIILKEGFKSSTFLPSVWEQLPAKEAFISELKKKAGLAAHYWSDEMEASRYTVDYWGEGSGTTS